MEVTYCAAAEVEKTSSSKTNAYCSCGGSCGGSEAEPIYTPQMQLRRLRERAAPKPCAFAAVEVAAEVVRTSPLATPATAAKEFGKTKFLSSRRSSCGGCQNESCHNLRTFSCGGCENESCGGGENLSLRNLRFCSKQTWEGFLSTFAVALRHRD